MIFLKYYAKIYLIFKFYKIIIKIKNCFWLKKWSLEKIYWSENESLKLKIAEKFDIYKDKNYEKILNEIFNWKKLQTKKLKQKF